MPLLHMPKVYRFYFLFLFFLSMSLSTPVRVRNVPKTYSLDIYIHIYRVFVWFRSLKIRFRFTILSELYLRKSIFGALYPLCCDVYIIFGNEFCTGLLALYYIIVTKGWN